MDWRGRAFWGRWVTGGMPAAGSAGGDGTGADFLEAAGNYHVYSRFIPDRIYVSVHCGRVYRDDDRMRRGNSGMGGEIQSIWSAHMGGR